MQSTEEYELEARFRKNEQREGFQKKMEFRSGRRGKDILSTCPRERKQLMKLSWKRWRNTQGSCWVIRRARETWTRITMMSLVPSGKGKSLIRKLTFNNLFWAWVWLFISFKISHIPNNQVSRPKNVTCNKSQRAIVIQAPSQVQTRAKVMN